MCRCCLKLGFRVTDAQIEVGEAVRLSDNHRQIFEAVTKTYNYGTYRIALGGGFRSQRRLRGQVQQREEILRTPIFQIQTILSTKYRFQHRQLSQMSRPN